MSSSSDDEDYQPGEGGDSSEGDEDDVIVAAAAARRSARLARRGAAAPRRPQPTRPPVAATPLARQVGLHTSARLDDLAPSTPSPSPSPAVALLRAREAAMTGGRPGWAACQRAHLGGGPFAPRAPAAVVDAMHSRAYIGHCSPSGNVFLAAFQQDRRLRVYDASPSAGPAVGAATAAAPGRAVPGPAASTGVIPGYPLLKDIECRLLRWTVTDVALSSDEALCAYASLNPVVHVVSLEGGRGVRSVANTTDIHAACPLDELVDAPPDARLPPFGVWALRFTPGSCASAAMLAGAGAGGAVYVHDCQRAKTTAVLAVHGDEWDVNALAFLDDASPHVFATGADDGLVKLVDTRTGSAPTVGLLAGHLAGITYLDARGDGVTLLSNSKDQTAKLWDVRRSAVGGGGPGTSAEAAALGPVSDAGGLAFDYRWQAVPRRLAAGVHAGDTSVATYRGHVVASTLIRARFSPPGPTGGAFVYAGSADGTPRVWDLVTGALVAELAYHGETVRDLSWHPRDPSTLITASFDGTCVRWGPSGEAGGVPDHAGGDALEDGF